jgi:protein-S-isoprenylcysteine O-methyltransferase Ste14
MVSAIFTVIGALIVVLRRWTYAGPLRLPVWVELVGWELMAIVTVFGFIADRQIGFRTRFFTPFFEPEGRIELRTTGAYGVVRHPIYAAGIGWLLATFLVTGYPGVLAAWAIFTLSTIWFSKREEEHLVTLLDDPTEYERYKARVPALFPIRLRRPEVA